MFKFHVHYGFVRFWIFVAYIISRDQVRQAISERSVRSVQLGRSFPFCQDNVDLKTGSSGSSTWPPHWNFFFFFFFDIAIYILWWPLMAQLVDLGSHSFRTSCPKGRCLVSRATATLIRSDSPNPMEPKNHRLDYRNAWITLKQELFVDLYIEACLDPGMSMPNFVKQVVETVQASLVSGFREAYHCLTNIITCSSRLVTVRISGRRRWITNTAG